MTSTAVIVRTEEQEADFAISVAIKAIEMFKEKELGKVKDNERRLLDNLIEDRFPDYNTRARKEKIKKAIKEGRLGGYDRENRPVASYSELKKYLFNK